MLKSSQDLAWLTYEQGSWDLSLIALKQPRLFDFPITIGSSLPSAALTKKAQVTLSLDFPSLVHCFDTSARDLFGSAR